MATILIAWELGFGLGHVMQLGPLANALAKRGHRVFAALRDLRHATAAFDPEVRLLPAPCQSPGAPVTRTARTFGHILADTGFADGQGLAARAEAWRNLYRLTRPDLMIFEHSPTALLASRGAPARRIVIGNGFLAPPDVSPFPDLRPELKGDAEQLLSEEAAMLEIVNRLLERWRQKPLARLGQLYSQVNDTLLMTFRELDPYARLRAPGARYLGPVNCNGGPAPRWPAGAGPKVFVYVRPFPALEGLLLDLKQRGHPTIAFIDGLAPAARERVACDSIRFESGRLDLARVGRECEVAILNGNFATTTALLLAGRPLLLLPRYLEHVTTSRSAARLGAALLAGIKDPAPGTQRLQTLIESGPYRLAAETFARRYRAFDPKVQQDHLLERVEALLNHDRNDNQPETNALTSGLAVGKA